VPADKILETLVRPNARATRLGQKEDAVKALNNKGLYHFSYLASLLE
jgi:hypothetical protein